ncbi:membrane protein [Bordetella ansorpii]|uniref:Membrane protein n=1 Tax=Bordetella ansorpii TaxID=288768 RepID=A0A157SG21_9BORD|nr:hypothetical protein [Bordetella ansorpii]SAI69390.1 membrane protein [Bordetella ansorpii]
MALVLARFLFGFVLSLACVSLLIAATWISTRVVALAIRHFPTRRAQDLASGAAVLIVVVLTLAGMYASGHLLYRALGDVLAQSLPHWLAGDDHLSAAAVLGALAGLGGLAYVPALWRRWRDRETTAPAPKSKGGDKPAKAASTITEKTAARPAPATSRAKAAEPAKGPRVPQLGWLALFLLAIGGVLLAFAFIVAPPNPDAAGTALAQAGRARPVYLAAAGLLGAGILFLLAWVGWRRPAPDAPRGGRSSRAAK